ncbi:trigger factor [Patescibacteria group bacterium]|nr:trigger factor [Patescibacteria group bacterium]
MKIDIKKLPKSQIELLITIPAEKWKHYRDHAVECLAGRVKIPGFRPGKADAKTIEKNLGPAAIMEEIAEHAVNDTYRQALQKHNFIPADQPKVDIIKLAPENDIIYKAVLSVIPPIALSEDYKKKLASEGIKLETPKVEEKELKESIEYLLNSRAKIVTVARPAQKGDRVEIDFETRLDNVKIEKGDSKHHPLIIGRSNFLPEFENNITGMKAGEEKEFNVVFPKDYYQKQLAGKNVSFKVKMNLAQEVITPKFDDEFAKSLGHFKEIKELEKSISEGIIVEKTKVEKEKFRTKIVEFLIKNYGAKELPDILVDSEVKRMLVEFKRNVEQNGMKFEEYLSQLAKTEASLKESWRQTAEGRINNYLITREIVKQENLKAPEEEITEQTNKILANYKNVKEAEKEIDAEKLKNNVHDVLITEKVLVLLEEIVLGEKPNSLKLKVKS